MKPEDFIFVGYLIQEPFWKSWPKREGYRVASIEREYHPKFNKHQWNTLNGVENPTRFLTELPNLETLSLEPHQCSSYLHKESPGWVISGYSFEREVVEHRRLISTDKKHTMLEFEYALQLHRSSDNLALLGYEVVDEDDIFLSILNNCGYTAEEVKLMAGPLNEYSLLSSIEHAERFNEAIKTDARNPKIIPDHSRGVIIQVWGKP